MAPPNVTLESESRSRTYRVRYFRSVDADAGFRDDILFEPPATDDVKAALLSRFNDPVRGHRPPTQAKVLDEQGLPILHLRVISPTMAHVMTSEDDAFKKTMTRVPQD